MHLGVGSREEAGGQGAGSKGEEFSPQQETPLCPIPHLHAKILD